VSGDGRGEFATSTEDTMGRRPSPSHRVEKSGPSRPESPAGQTSPAVAAAGQAGAQVGAQAAAPASAHATSPAMASPAHPVTIEVSVRLQAVLIPEAEGGY